MKNYYLILILLLTTSAAFAQSSNPKIMWVNPIQSTSDSPDETGMEVMDVAVAPDGSTYVAGYCTSPCTFAQGVSVIPDAGGQSVFIAKYRNDGLFEWVKDLGTIGEHSAHIVAPAMDGVYLATSFSVSSIDLGNGIIVEKSCNTASCDEALLAKFGLSGETIWANTYKGNIISNFQVSGIEQSSTGQLITLISYDADILDLGPGFVFNNQPSLGFFLSVVNASNGATIDVKFPATFLSFPFTQSLAFNQNGQGVMTGIFFDQISFLNGPTLTTNNEGSAHFAAGIDGSGNVQWARKLSSSDYLDILAAEMDDEGAAYLAIDASEEIGLDNSIILSINTTYAGTVLKLNGNSFSIPVFIPYDSDDYAVMDVAVDPWGTINTVGYTSETISFGNNLIIPDGCVDGFITRTKADGLPLDARTIGGGGCEAYGNYYYGSCMEFDDAGFLYGAGGFLFNFNEDGINFNGQGGFVSKFIAPTLSTNELKVLVLDAFPNPNSGSFTIQLPEIPESEAFLSITNLNGQEVYRQSGIQQEIFVKTTLSSGIYLVSVIDGKRVYQQKVTVL